MKKIIIEPIKNYIVIEAVQDSEFLEQVSEVEETPLVLLPESFKQSPGQKYYRIVDEIFHSFGAAKGKIIIVDETMIETVNIGNESFMLIHENYVKGFIKILDTEVEEAKQLEKLRKQEEIKKVKMNINNPFGEFGVINGHRKKN